MFLGSVPQPSQHDTLAAALQHAKQYGHRPAVTAVTPEGRYEQSFASLAQWAAKGAHLLTSDLMLGPGARLAIASPVSWHTSAIVLAAWWVGINVTTVTDGADVIIVDGDTPDVPTHAAVFCVGSAIDGAPHTPTTTPAWTHEVRMFPDLPPAPQALPSHIALSDGFGTVTHQDVCAATFDGQVCGVDVTGGVTVDVLKQVAARPLLTGQRTVIIDRVSRASVASERVDVWR